MELYFIHDIAVYKNNQIIFGRSNLGRFVAVAGGSRFADADCVCYLLFGSLPAVGVFGHFWLLGLNVFLVAG